MSLDVPDTQDDRTRASRKKRLLLVLVLLAVVAVGSYVLLIWWGLKRARNAAGSVDLLAPPAARIYVGDRLVGMGRRSFTWRELLGEDGQEPIAIELRAGQTVTAADLAGPGAKVLESTGAGGGSAGWVGGTRERYLLRRADGSLDQVFALVIDWCPKGGPARRLLLPLRVRQGTGEASVFFQGTGSTFVHGGGIVLLPVLPTRLQMSWEFGPGRVPDEFAAEFKAKGFWEPAAQP